MDSLNDAYRRAIRERLGGFVENWPPDRPLELGDICVRQDGGAVVKVSSLKELGISPKAAVGKSDKIEFKTGKGTHYKFFAKGEDQTVLNGQAGVSIEFGSKNSVAVFGSSCEYHTISNRNTVFAQVTKLAAAKKWDESWFFVHELTRASRLNVFISQAEKAKMDLTATGDVGQIDLVNVDVDLKVVASQEEIFNLLNAKGATAYFKGLHFRKDFWEKLTSKEPTLHPAKFGDSSDGDGDSYALPFEDCFELVSID